VDVALPPSAGGSEVRASVELLGEQTRLARELDRVSAEFNAAVGKYGWQGGRPRRSTTELQKLAITDSLTGIFNRRHFHERLAIEFQWLQSSRASLSLMLIDLDNFKPVNDRHGFSFGDRVLRHVAQSVARSVRANDLVCRYGGEELVVLAPGCNEASSLVLAERLRAAVASEAISEGATTIQLTCSLGIASATLLDPATADELIRRADIAVHVAKLRGKNMAVHWSELSSAPDAEPR